MTPGSYSSELLEHHTLSFLSFFRDDESPAPHTGAGLLRSPVYTVWLLFGEVGETLAFWEVDVPALCRGHILLVMHKGEGSTPAAWHI